VVKPRSLTLIKIGGRALEAPGALQELAADVAATCAPALIVHGGGGEVSEWSLRLGLTPRFVDGLRVTDAATLEVVAAVLAGLANKRLVAALREQGVNAAGLSALDGGLVEVARHPRAHELGAVGAVSRVNPALLETLFESGITPVLASLGALEGQLLNVNADDLAVALAVELGASDLILLSDVPGVRLDGEIVPELDRAGLERALDHPDVTGGMTPKLRSASVAIERGVGRVHIAAWQGAGTLARLLSGDAVATRIASTSKENAHA
jgi:acetylglutamate kinase